MVIGVGRVILEQRVLHCIDLIELLRLQLAASASTPSPNTAALAVVPAPSPIAAPPPASRTTCGSTGAAALFHYRENAHMNPRLEFQLLHQLRGRFLGRAVEQLRVLAALGQIDAVERNPGAPAAAPRSGRADALDLLGLGFLMPISVA
jgi:hypothetical protein